MSVTRKLRFKLDIIHESADDLTTPSEVLPTITYDIADGTSADEMDLLWHDQRTVAASSSEDLDLYGSLVNVFGDTMSFADVRLLIVKANADNTNNVLVGGASANQFINWVGDASDVVSVKPNGILFLYAPSDPGYAVTSGTGDILKIANSGAGTSVTYDIYVGGVSA